MEILETNGELNFAATKYNVSCAVSQETVEAKAITFDMTYFDVH